MKQSIVIQGRFPSLNDVIKACKSHYGAYSKMKKEMTLSVAWQATQLKRHEQPVSITFTWYEPNSNRDIDNVRHGAKYILDGLVEAGVLDGDGQKHVQQLKDFFHVDKIKPRVLITIEDL